ncbi:AAA family ATPase [Clostridiaceae bacterium Marseille-Q4149]|nr:AAA family ATPase [Clostridiaceae bacterium Marseille-Q4149]
MELSEMQARAAELERLIADLPAGSITKKTVNGKEYFYHRWTEDKKRREKYIPADELEDFRAQIEQRKALERELKALKKQLPKGKSVDTSAFTTNVRTGEALHSFASPVRAYRKRECFRQLHDYIYGGQQDKVFILYGLRRTGKTTMIRQIFAEMSEAELAKVAFIQITARDTLADVNRDLKLLEAQGFRYVFLDEVTLMEDFIEGAALFSDVFAACGMKTVLSGADSMGFLFAEDEQLYGRCILLHTTFIPYREFESVLGIHGIDEYIRYGGTMSLGGIHYNETSTFASRESADEYVDTAIARNIQHSLRCYQYEGHFRHLWDLYDKNELTSAINRVVEDINHRFTLEVLSQDWKSHDLGISASNLRRDRENPTDILDCIDLAAVTDSLRKLLEIRNKAEQTVKLDDVHAAEIKEYLDLLDLTREIDVLHLPDVGTKSSRTAIAQPGLRYAQADALIRSLLLDETFSALSLAERTAVQQRILTDIKGRMLKDIVLLETKLATPKKQVFVLQFPVGEFDMVVFDPNAGSCRIFEIKHSEEAAPQQYRHLIDAEKCAQTEHRYGPITGRFVLYRGKDQVVEGIQYQNVEEYLKTLV